MTAVTINEDKLGPVGIRELENRLTGIEHSEHCEVWLDHPTGSALCLLKSGSRAMLMLLRGDGDSGMSSRANDVADRSDNLKFILSDGQVDEYPLAWTVPFDDAKRAAKYFWSSGKPAPHVQWHDDVNGRGHR